MGLGLYALGYHDRAQQPEHRRLVQTHSPDDMVVSIKWGDPSMNPNIVQCSSGGRPERDPDSWKCPHLPRFLFGSSSVSDRLLAGFFRVRTLRCWDMHSVPTYRATAASQILSCFGGSWGPLGGNPSVTILISLAIFSYAQPLHKPYINPA